MPARDFTVTICLKGASSLAASVDRLSRRLRKPWGRRQYVGPFNWVPRRWMRRPGRIQIKLNTMTIAEAFADVDGRFRSHGIVDHAPLIPAAAWTQLVIPTISRWWSPWRRSRFGFELLSLRDLMDWLEVDDEDWSAIGIRPSHTVVLLHTTMGFHLPFANVYLQEWRPAAHRVDFDLVLPIQNWLACYRAGALDD